MHFSVHYFRNVEADADRDHVHLATLANPDAGIEALLGYVGKHAVGDGDGHVEEQYQSSPHTSSVSLL